MLRRFVKKVRIVLPTTRFIMETEKKICGSYSNEHSILVVGDGDFSFSLSLCKKLQNGMNLVATSYDSHECVTTKYPESIKFIEEIKESGSVVLHGVDASDLRNTLVLPEGSPLKYDRIIFQFPLVYSQPTKEEYIADPDNCIRNRRLIRYLLLDYSIIFSIFLIFQSNRRLKR